MSLSTEILAVLLLSVIATATNTDLATNTNFLLLLLLALAAYNSCNPNCCCRNRFLTNNGGFI